MVDWIEANPVEFGYDFICGTGVFPPVPHSRRSLANAATWQVRVSQLGYPPILEKRSLENSGIPAGDRSKRGAGRPSRKDL